MAIATNPQVCVERHVSYPYDVWATEMSDLQRARLRDMYALIDSGATALDIGCNSGYAALFRPDCSWSGVDVSPALVAKAQHRMDAQVAQAESLPFNDNAFDYAVLGEILEHVYDPRIVIAEAARVVTKGIVGTTPHEDGRWGKRTVDDHPFHVRCFSERELRDLLSEFGAAIAQRIHKEFLLFEVAL